jgi:hypothetical protein
MNKVAAANTFDETARVRFVRRLVASGLGQMLATGLQSHVARGWCRLVCLRSCEDRPCHWVPVPSERGQRPFVCLLGIFVVSVVGTRVSSLTRFGDKGLVALFGLPRTIPRNGSSDGGHENYRDR